MSSSDVNEHATRSGQLDSRADDKGERPESHQESFRNVPRSFKVLSWRAQKGPTMMPMGGKRKNRRRRPPWRRWLPSAIPKRRVIQAGGNNRRRCGDRLRKPYRAPRSSCGVRIEPGAKACVAQHHTRQGGYDTMMPGIESRNGYGKGYVIECLTLQKENAGRKPGKTHRAACLCSSYLLQR